jgi:hypothetical protein
MKQRAMASTLCCGMLVLLTNFLRLPKINLHVIVLYEIFKVQKPAEAGKE